MNMLFVSVIVICFWGQVSTVDPPDSNGYEFVVSFASIYYDPEPTPPELYISTLSEQEVSYTVSTPLVSSNPDITGSVVRGVYNEPVLIPTSTRTSAAKKYDSGVYIKADEPVTVQAMNKENYNMDAFTLYPIDVLGKKYMAINFKVYPVLTIVAAEEGATTVQVTWKLSAGSVVYNGVVYNDGDTTTETLNQFQVMYYYEYKEIDITGTYIEADKKIAVFSGCWFTGIPLGSTADHVLEQILPEENKGWLFPLIPSPYRKVGEVYRIVAGEDNTAVTIHGVGTHTLNRGDHMDYWLPVNTYTVANSSAGINVYHFAKSWTAGSGAEQGGDPSMTYIPPVQQWMSQHLYSAMKCHPKTGDFTHAAGIIIHKDHKDGIVWNGNPLVIDTWYDLQSSDLVAGYLDLNETVHDFYHNQSNVNFVILEYGLAWYASYGTVSGSRGSPINVKCNITEPEKGDGLDNDCDRWVDEEIENGFDDDGDGLVDEDLAADARVDGQWGEWSEWSCECDDQNQTMVRTRLCDNPPPFGAGLNCVGEAAEINSTACECDIPETTKQAETTRTTIKTTTTEPGTSKSNEPDTTSTSEPEATTHEPETTTVEADPVDKPFQLIFYDSFVDHEILTGICVGLGVPLCMLVIMFGVCSCLRYAHKGRILRKRGKKVGSSSTSIPMDS